MLVVVVLILCTSRYLFQYLELRMHDDIIVIAAITMMSLCALAEKNLSLTTSTYIYSISISTGQHWFLGIKVVLVHP